MIDIAPGRMLAARGVVKLIAEKTVLPVKEKMQQRACDGEDPHPSAERRGRRALTEFRWLRDYCTFFGAAAAVDPSTREAETM